jgi:hypothetical protein
MTLSEQLDAAMRKAYVITGKETEYWGHYFLRSVKKNGGLATAKRMLSKTANRIRIACLSASACARFRQIPVEDGVRR